MAEWQINSNFNLFIFATAAFSPFEIGIGIEWMREKGTAVERRRGLGVREEEKNKRSLENILFVQMISIIFQSFEEGRIKNTHTHTHTIHGIFLSV